MHQLALGVAFHGISPARAEMQSIAGGSSDRELAMHWIAVFGEHLFVSSDRSSLRDDVLVVEILI